MGGKIFGAIFHLKKTFFFKKDTLLVNRALFILNLKAGGHCLGLRFFTIFPFEVANLRFLRLFQIISDEQFSRKVVQTGRAISIFERLTNALRAL